MFTVDNLPATMRFDPTAPHRCGHSGCQNAPETNTAPTSDKPRYTGVTSTR